LGFVFTVIQKWRALTKTFAGVGRGGKREAQRSQGAVDVQAVVVCPAQEVVGTWRGGSWIEEGASPSSQKKKGPRLIHPVEREGNREGSYGYGFPWREGNREGSYGYGYDRLEITNNPFYVCYLNRPNE
jgi:hypothetical protein